MRIFEALLKGVSTQFGLRIVENSIENTHVIFCSSFQNLRLGSINLLQKIVASQKTNTSHHICYYLCNHLANFMLPKRRFWKAEQKMTSGFSIDFSMVRSPNRVLTPLKSASKTHSEMFVRPSKIFVWEG